MAQNFKQRGDILQYTNTGSADVASEELIVFGALAGVALADIPAGGTGSVQISGVFALPKKADDAPTQGQALYWNATDKVVTGFGLRDGFRSENGVPPHRQGGLCRRRKRHRGGSAAELTGSGRKRSRPRRTQWLNLLWPMLRSRTLRAAGATTSATRAGKPSAAAPELFSRRTDLAGHRS